MNLPVPPVAADRRGCSPVLDILATAAAVPDAPALLWRQADGSFAPMPFRDLARAVCEVACALHAAGIRAGDRVLLLAESRPEWVLADLGILACGAADVPVYPSGLAPQVLHQWRDSGARALFASSMPQVEKALEAIREGPAPRPFVVFDADAAGDGRETLDAFRAAGRAAWAADPGLPGRLLATVGADALATIVYTSGTTGTPKGVRLTHGNFAANVAVADVRIPRTPDEVALSMLPLAHVLERTAGCYGFLRRGAAIAYAESVRSVADDLQRVRPTLLVAVPRVFEKLHGRVQDALAGAPAWRRAIARGAFAVGRAWSRRVEAHGRAGPVLGLARALADRLVFRRLRDRLGGRLRYVFCGGAPLAADLARFFHAAGVLILEGYGLTETSPIVAVNHPGAFRFGTVGRPLENVQVRIASDGEIEVRGPSVTSGYHGRPDATAEVLAPDGFLRTGDLGYLDPDGFLVITGRKKDLLVTAGGKKIVPGVLEERLRQDPLVAEAVLCGEGKPFATALVVADLGAVRRALPAAAAATGADGEALCQQKAVRALYGARIAAAQGDQEHYARVRRFTLLAQPFTEEGGELTPTQKVRRREVFRKHQRRIELMYRGGGVEVPGEEQAAGGADPAPLQDGELGG